MISYKLRQFKFIFTIGMLVILFFAFILLIAKNKSVILDDVNEINFSVESGFYDNEFDLEISAFGGEIYYTLDGSTPTCESIKYDGPIHISDATYNKNVYCMRTDLYPEEFSSYYVTPNYNVDKCTIVRAVLYYGENNYSKIKTASYFVGFDNKNGYEGMNYISIVTDPYNLFDFEEGIYCNGEVYASSENHDNGLWMGNYSMRGRDAERNASCQFFDKDGQLLLSQTCGIRTHGGSGRNRYPKSLNIYSREEYNNRDYFTIDFFGNDYYPSVVTLFHGSQDETSLLMDYLMNNLMEELDVSTMEFVPYVMFLNGEYWGVYWITEKYNKEYIQNHYDVSSDNVIMIKADNLEEGTEEDYKLYEEMIDFCESADMTVSDNYSKVCDLIDINSYIDYYAALIYIAREGDWPTINEAMWRTREIGDGEYEDGKWRWMVYDINSSAMKVEFIECDSINYVMENSIYNDMFRNMMNSEKFRNDFLDRLEELSNTIFLYDNIESKIDEFRSLMDEPMKYNMKRFFGDDSYYLYEDKIASILYFFENRGEYIKTLIEEYR